MLGIDLQTVFGMPPVDYVRFAAELGCPRISAALGPMPWNPCNFPVWSLRDDANLRREMAAAMRDTGVSIFLAEGFAIRPNANAHDRAKDLDLMAELGAQRIGTVCLEPDLARGYDELATLCEMTVARGMGLTLEFAPPHPINNLQLAVAALQYLDNPHAQLTLDAMHFFRSGGNVSDLKSLDAALIGHVQLCDVPITPLHNDYMQEACFERLPPGEGELPLRDFIASLPQGVRIGIEVPMIKATKNEKTFKAAIAHIVEVSRQLLNAEILSGG